MGQISEHGGDSWGKYQKTGETHGANIKTRGRLMGQISEHKGHSWGKYQNTGAHLHTFADVFPMIFPRLLIFAFSFSDVC